MGSFASLLQQGHSWLFVPSAVLLGALHGLEPGHSKTMMAAFIVAIRGTLGQAVLLGLSATVSHTAIVWVVALGGLYFGRNWSTQATEPYLQIASAVLIVAVAAWMLWRTRQLQNAARAAGGHTHDEHGHSHDHHHHDHDPHRHAAPRRIDTGHGVLRLGIFAQGGPARFRLYPQGGPAWHADQIHLETERRDGSRQRYSFHKQAGYLESVQEIREPHEFIARLRIAHGSHSHDFDVEFAAAGHTHAIADFAALDLTAPGYQDPHELAHADDIRRRFANREVTTAQIVVFGLTGGLIPCPASITVLLLCLQMKQLALGALLVLCFGVGLALTMVSFGAVAALGLRHAARRFRGFTDIARRAPYFSGALILLVGCYVGYQGWHALG
ncbi:MAG TPA: nickel/cobalt efflux transporter [Steroidobacteraceae bacterium]|nr:nickel/cobalt efflux transporter [Steroidobacteraceae bacterium]